MSKELETFNIISDKLNGFEHYEQVEINKQLEIILQALTPPTEEEVCKALSEELGVSIYYNQLHRYFYYEVLEIVGRNKKEIIICTFTKRSQNHKNETLEIKYDFTPHIITMISRFYKGKIKNE